MNPCLGYLYCHGYTRKLVDGKILHEIDCYHFKQHLGMPETQTKFHCIYFELDE